ncbi:MAG: hypothetical protein HQL47_09975 [Gammaproteobacteria bacterium]|nr:hypothetical protein [Gammaproteobacteria bacterium]
MANPYKRLLALLPGQPIQTGTVAAVGTDGVTVTLPTGENIKVRGTATIGDVVYIRDGAIEGPAPDLAGTIIDV